jgi:hypothetical protein
MALGGAEYDTGIRTLGSLGEGGNAIRFMNSSFVNFYAPLTYEFTATNVACRVFRLGWLKIITNHNWQIKN